ncbi:hypothetical protein KY284_004300 [Solanum tuberosum]|nr:hypothetical protein KY284_004300 [Solanum tuberosum]
MASSTNTLSTSSLHHLISFCSIKLKPTNYLIWRTQMSQLIQVMRLIYIITEPPKGIYSTRQTTEKAVADEKEESMYLIVGCSTAKKMWECLEEAYLQATKDKEFQLKQKLQSVKLGTETIDEYIKEFKGICDDLVAIHNPVDEDSKVINFARGLGLKYKTFMTVMLGRGRGNYSQRRGNNNFNFRGRDFKPAGQGTCSYDSRNGPGPQNIPSSRSHERNNIDACQICARNNHTALKCFYKWDYSYQAADELPQASTATNLQNTIDDTLYVDSGASSHMTHNSGFLTDLKHYNGPDKIIIGNGSKLDITHVGNISGPGLKLKEVLVVPKINKKLLSVRKLAKDNCCTLEFDETNFVVKDKKTMTLLPKGTKKNRLYALEDNNLYALTAAHDWNTLSSLVLKMVTQFVKLYGEQPDYNSVKMFGCRCFPYIKGSNKFSPKTYPCVFIGYNSLHKGYSCYHPPTMRVYISRHVMFDENTLPYVSPNQSQTNIYVSAHLATFVESFSKLQAHDNSDSGEVHASSTHVNGDNVVTTHIPVDDESTIDLSGAESDAEKQVECNDPYSSIKALAVDFGSASGNEEHVALTGPVNEYHQITILVDIHVDYQSNNATLQSTTSVDVLVEKEINAFHTNKKWILEPKSPDINLVGPKWVFKTKLNPDGTIDSYKARLIARGFSQLEDIDLEKLLALWLKTTTIRVVLSIIISSSKADSSLFTLQAHKGSIFLLLYVDDIIITGVEVKYFDEGIHLSQSKYAAELLDKTEMTLAKVVATHLAQKHGLHEAVESLVDASFYRMIVGNFQYLTLTRLDITHVVNLASQFMQNSNSEHLQGVKRVLRYIKGTLHFELRIISQSPYRLYGYLDADWGVCTTTRRSTTSYNIYLDANCISWTSKKQSTVARSSAQVKYRALASTASEMTWIIYLLHDLGAFLQSVFAEFRSKPGVTVPLLTSLSGSVKGS